MVAADLITRGLNPDEISVRHVAAYLRQRGDLDAN